MHIRGRAAQVAVESLESRKLLAVTFVPKSGWLYVNGSDGVDDISVRAHKQFANLVTVVVKNAAGREEASVVASEVRVICVDAAGADDRVHVDGTVAALAGEVSVWIEGGDGNDDLASALPGTAKLGAGHDLFNGSGGAFSVDAGVGSDVITIADGAHTVLGGDGSDRVTVGEGFRSIATGAGDDRVTAPGNTGTVELGNGNDVVVLGRRIGKPSRAVQRLKPTAFGGAGDDTLISTDAADRLYGGDGNDELLSEEVLWLHSSDYIPDFDSLSGGAGDDVIRTAVSHGRFWIWGDEGGDRIELSESYDAHVYGGSGDDVIHSVSGEIYGDDGDDRIEVRAGTVHGGAGDDVLIGKGLRTPSIYGDEGDDEIDVDDTVYANVYGGDGDDHIRGGQLTTAYGNDGRDTFSNDHRWSKKEQGDPPAPQWPPFYGDGTGIIVTAGLTLTSPARAAAATAQAEVMRLALEPLGDVGYLVVRRPAYDGQGGRSAADPWRGAAERSGISVELTKAEERAAGHGIVRLPTGWKATLNRVTKTGFAWYDLRFGKGGDKTRTVDYDTVYHLCITAGSLLVTQAGDFTSAAGRIVAARAGTAIPLRAGDVARLAGGDDAATYPVSHRQPAPDAKFAKGRTGLLVEGGVLWEQTGQTPSAFARIR